MDRSQPPFSVLGRERVWKRVAEGGRCFLVFISCCSSLLLVIGNKLHLSLCAESVLPVTLIGE